MRKYGKSMFEVLSEMQEGIKPYVSMMRDNGKMKYRVLDKNEKEILVTTDSKKAEDFFKKNYNKLRAGSIKPMKEETDLEEKMVTAVYTDKKTRKVMSLKFKDKKTANDFFQNNKVAAGQINFREEVEEVEDLEEFTSSQIARLKKEYESLRGKEKSVSPDKFAKLRKMMDRFQKPNLLALAKADIPILSSAAKAKLVIKFGMSYKSLPEELIPYIDVFADNLRLEQKGKFKSVDPKVIDRIEKMMRGSREEKDSIANMLNYLMPPEVVDMVRYKLKIVPKRGKIKF